MDYCIDRLSLVVLSAYAVYQFEAELVSIFEVTGLHLEVGGQEVVRGHTPDEELRR
jgi:hypothetical protein